MGAGAVVGGISACHDPDVDFSTIELVIARFRAVDERAHGKAELAVRKPELCGTAAMSDDPDFWIVERESWDRTALRAGQLLADLTENFLAERHQLGKLRPYNIDVDIPPLVEASLKNAALVDDDEGSWNLRVESHDRRDELAHPKRVVRVDADERLVCERHEKEPADAATWLRFGFVRVGLGLP